MRIAGLLKNDMVDGLGFSVSLWTQGCPFRCTECHNPETWDATGGTIVSRERLIDEILTSLHSNGVQRNFSVLGGEPLYSQNCGDVNAIISAVRAANPDIKIVVWTGYTWDKLRALNNPDVEDILKQIDILIDGQFEIENRDITLWLRGSSNQRVIDVQKSLRENRVCEY